VATPARSATSRHWPKNAGWNGILLEDYVVYQNRQRIPTYDPWIALAAMVLRTTNLRLGTEVTPLARRRPWKLAGETATLDHLSGGRLILGRSRSDVVDRVGAAGRTGRHARGD
jgi:alkanesulfonate monooxygenase SsuD/methylene tetrahydromethanopterin reductase-like flavin-dependent oxidoreductase (luciferase family)